ncbi:MAG: urate hydroxylase PuuD [Candidatus Wallbacteria bacterium]|nr:urate hydroxylase PuuD [Candidatus Wallbacteria bacterium]
MDFNTIFQFLLRWIHFMAGIVWIGHLWFFNLVNANFQKEIEGPVKKVVNPRLMYRSLFWFRWGAMFTFLTGWIYLLHKAGIQGFHETFVNQSWGQWILLGALLGTRMWYNVWFVIWPNQQLILAAIDRGEAPPADKVAKAGAMSRENTFNSVPLLFTMGAATHLPLKFQEYWWVFIVALGIGYGIAKFFLDLSATAGKWESPASQA